MTPVEIERKYTIRELPPLGDYECHVIEQAYLCTDPVVRIRRENDSYYMTYKGSGMLSREEYNLPLNEEAYMHLRAKADGILLTKKRYLIPIPEPQWKDGYIPEPQAGRELKVELDIFEGVYQGLMLAEVEFHDQKEADAFLPLSWFQEDVTFDPRFHNSVLSRGVEDFLRPTAE